MTPHEKTQIDRFAGVLTSKPAYPVKRKRNRRVHLTDKEKLQEMDRKLWRLFGTGEVRANPRGRHKKLGHLYHQIMRIKDEQRSENETANN
jgi:hypothetical protein